MCRSLDTHIKAMSVRSWRKEEEKIELSSHFFRYVNRINEDEKGIFLVYMLTALINTLKNLRTTRITILRSLHVTSSYTNVP